MLPDAKEILEGALLTSEEPLPLSQLKKLFNGETSAENISELLDEIRSEWSGKAVELVEVASGWRFCTRPEMQQYLDRLTLEKPPRYSRAVLETLAVIAYRQPATRGDIEETRGVSVSTHVLRTLEARGWIEVVGQRETPGRPLLYATTPTFLDDLNLTALDQLPPLEEIASLLAEPELAAQSGNGAEEIHDAPVENQQPPPFEQSDTPRQVAALP